MKHILHSFDVNWGLDLLILSDCFRPRSNIESYGIGGGLSDSLVRCWLMRNSEGLMLLYSWWSVALQVMAPPHPSTQVIVNHCNVSDSLVRVCMKNHIKRRCRLGFLIFMPSALRFAQNAFKSRFGWNGLSSSSLFWYLQRWWSASPFNSFPSWSLSLLWLSPLMSAEISSNHSHWLKQKMGAFSTLFLWSLPWVSAGTLQSTPNMISISWEISPPNLEHTEFIIAVSTAETALSNMINGECQQCTGYFMSPHSKHNL